VDTFAGKIPKISSDLTFTDRFGTYKARWKIDRMKFLVDPGLYALNEPDPASPVLVTANYKMSFDSLRSALPGISAWLLVLDTQGINVWCAAGKGTFGTDELVNRIDTSGLRTTVSHNRLILPQLGAPGVSAHRVKKLSGFKVIYGPIDSSDLPEFIASGLEATPEMRTKTFTLRERAAVIPVELVGALTTALYIIPVLLILSAFGGPYGYWTNVTHFGLVASAGLVIAIIAGTVLFPLLLPWLPGRAFSVKGFAIGIVTSLAFIVLRASATGESPNTLETGAWVLLITAIVSYFGMNFTGCSTYTSLSGVKKEMKWAVPLQIAAVVAGIALWVSSGFLA
jgi:acetyl-CoA decarbonylase/synthase complex subunit gamma